MADIPASPARSRTLIERIGQDLGPRVASGIALAGAVAATTLAGVWTFNVLVAIICLVVAWEWGRIVRRTEGDAAMVVHMVTAVTAAGLTALGQPILALSAIVVGVALTALLSSDRHPGYSALGTAATGLPAIAMIWLRADEPWGLAAVLIVMGLVVTTDTAAYFSGRLIGGPKLWPQVSPNKTWAGLFGAVIASAVVAWTIGFWLVGATAWHLAIFGAFLAVVAQAGDLAESALKRKFGAKDASNIIPGHGGFMDRIDGLAAAVVFAALFGAAGSVTNPARALLTW